MAEEIRLPHEKPLPNSKLLATRSHAPTGRKTGSLYVKTFIHILPTLFITKIDAHSYLDSYSTSEHRTCPYGIWSKALPQTASYFSTLPWFESQPRCVRELPVTWGWTVVSLEYCSFFHDLYLATLEFSLNMTKKWGLSKSKFKWPHHLNFSMKNMKYATLRKFQAWKICSMKISHDISMNEDFAPNARKWFKTMHSFTPCPRVGGLWVSRGRASGRCG